MTTSKPYSHSGEKGNKMSDKELKKAVQDTADYLFKIDADVPPKVYQQISMLRQLVNEVYKPETQISNQAIYDSLKEVL